MKTDGDLNFNISSDIINPVFDGELSDTSESAFIVIKSDEIRIVARKEEDRDEINGSIRIIKEGSIGEDQASIYLLPDGVVQITGSKVFIGQADQGSGPGDGGSEPYVKYSELESLINQILDDVGSFCQTLQTHIVPLYAGQGSPQIIQAATELSVAVEQRKQEIPNLKSERIFGE